ncbi:MAG: aminoglycoside phosphotransferase family protein [Steroidobacteraceae bacterium]
MPENDARLALLQGWLARDLGLRPASIERASSDASFRRYFRVVCDDCTLVAMDAPPATEDVRPYLHVTALLEPLGIHVPHIYEADVAQGFVLLEDLGCMHYLAQLDAGGDPRRLYGDALQALAEIQLRGAAAAAELPPYDRAPLARELALMPEWFLDRHLALQLSAEERETLVAAFEFLIGAALSQPEVFVHRDYHSRNLMVVGERNPGVIDFQDALRGPVGYDLVSLLKDCYVSWPRERVLEWVRDYRSLLQSRGGRVGGSPTQFLRWFDLIGVQRHIKVLGVFARLWYRDGKSGYLRDLPLTLDYVRATCRLYPELAELSRFLETRVAPELPRANERVARETAPPA